jgi:uncharacterized repeat protein (TIGR01451 family)
MRSETVLDALGYQSALFCANIRPMPSRRPAPRRSRLLLIFLPLLATATDAMAAPGETTLASTSDAGVKSNGSSFGAIISDEGSRVAFYSSATNLDPADSDTINDTYVKDLVTGDIVLASTSDLGVKANAAAVVPDISADGTKVAFYSHANNLDPADPDFLADIYVKDLVTGDIVLASTSDAGVKGNRDSFVPTISADGTSVAFYSSSNNLDPADGDLLPDVFVKDLVTGDIVLASTSDAGVKGNNESILPAISGDGGRVAFASKARNLDPADTDTTEDIYVKDLITGDIVLASTSDAGLKGNASSVEATLSSDGVRVGFVSFSSNLDPADVDTDRDIYVKDIATGDLTLASASDAGVKSNAGSFRPDISADGRRVGFDSNGTNLDPVDVDPTLDIYVKDLVTGDVALASASDTGEKGTGHSIGPTLSDDGMRVAFSSNATNLEPADEDALSDIYVKEHALVDLSLVKSDSADRAPTGRTLTYTLMVANSGPDIARGVIVMDSLPASVTFVSATPTQGTCAHSDGAVRCALGAMGIGATARVDIVVRPTTAGTITNFAAVSAPASESTPANNTGSENTRVCRQTSNPTSIPCR